MGCMSPDFEMVRSMMEPIRVPKPLQAEEEEDQGQEQEHMQCHKDPRGLKLRY